MERQWQCRHEGKLDDRERADSHPPKRRNAWEMFLLNLRYRDSRLVTLGGNEPFLLSGDGSGVAGLQGHGGCFRRAARRTAQPTGARYPLFRAETGQLLLGMDLSAARSGWWQAARRRPNF